MHIGRFAKKASVVVMGYGLKLTLQWVLTWSKSSVERKKELLSLLVDWNPEEMPAYKISPQLKFVDFPDCSVVKKPPANAGNAGLIPRSGRFPGGENGNPLQYSCLGNPMDRGTWQTTFHGVTKESDLI